MKCGVCGHYIERHNGIQARACLEKAMGSKGREI